MGKVVKKIVATGGPCSGKTSGACYLVKPLALLGWRTLILPEMATMTIMAGISPKGDDMPNKYFQTGIIKGQVAMEKQFEYYASKLNCDKVLLLCDRGLMDNRAYCSSDEFEYVLKQIHLDKVTARDSYDGVMDLVTAADGAEEYYTCANNAARTEGLALARELEQKVRAAWTGHPHLRIIDNNCAGFEEKKKKLLDEVCACLGEPTPIEIERSFLIKMPETKILELYNAVPVTIYQTYLKSYDGVERRVRQRGENGNYLYFYTEKRGGSKRERVEVERRISYKEYLFLLTQADTSLKPILKKRYCFVWNSTYYECDIYPQWEDKAILEVELMTREEELKIPDFIKVIREVTDDEKYRNYSIAKGLAE